MARPLTIALAANIDELKKGLNQGQTEVQGFGDVIEKFGKKILAAFSVAAVVDFTKEVAKAAMQEEESITRLNQTLDDFTKATDEQIKGNERFVETLSNATAIADDNLRPAMARLARSLGDVQAAQEATTLAAKISVNTGKDVETIANAMAKAADGQTTSLARLGLGFSAAELKGKDFGQIVDMLNERFPDLGANADTTSFKFKQFQNLIENTKESIGAALLPILTKFFEFVINNLNPALERIANLFKPIVNAIKENKQAFEDLGQVAKVIFAAVGFLVENFLSKVADTVAGIINLFGKIESAIRPAVQAVMNVLNGLIDAYNNTIGRITGNSIGKLGMGGGGSSSQTSTSSSALLKSIGGLSSSVGSLASSVSGFTNKSGGGGAADNSAASKMLAQLEADVATLNTLQEILTSTTINDPRYAQGISPAAQYNITVNGAIDAEGTAQTIVSVLTDSAARGGAASGIMSKLENLP